MSRYNYFCEVCDKIFEYIENIGWEGPSECPECGEPRHKGFNTDFANQNVCLGKGCIPVTTFGQQSEINRRKMGKEQMSKMWDDYKSKDPKYITRNLMKREEIKKVKEKYGSHKPKSRDN